MSGEKTRLVPKLRFPDFLNAGTWDVDGLGVVANFVNEKIALELVVLENYVSTENILADFGGIDRASKLPKTGSVTRFQLDDTLVSNIRPYLKKVWVADKEGGASNDVIVIRAKQRLLPQYLSSLLKNDAFIDYVMTGAKGVKMPRGDVGSMKAYPAPYPSKPEQQKIADCLSSLDELIAAQARKVEALRTHKKGLMQQLFPIEGETQPRLRFPEFRGVALQNVLLGDVTEEGRSRNGNKHFAASVMGVNKSDGIVPMEARLIAADIARYKLVESDWFAYNPMRLNIGSIARWTGEREILVSPDYVVFKCITNGELSIVPDYLDHFRYTENWISFVTEGGDGSVRVRIYYRDIALIGLALPSPSEQQKIADCLTSLYTLITAASQELDILKTHKKGLMQQLFPSAEAVEA